MAQNDGPTPPVICGKNSGYHMILNAREACNTLTFSWQSSSTREWNIQVIIRSDYTHDNTVTTRLLQVMQISCNAAWKPAEGCLQYFTGTTGTIYSYNYDGSYHLVNQHYDNCIR